MNKLRFTLLIYASALLLNCSQAVPTYNINSNNNGSSTNPSSNANQTDSNTATPTNSPNTATPSTNSNLISLTGLSRYTLVGRFDISNVNAIQFSFENSKIGITVQNTTSLSVVLADTGEDRFLVTIDGNRGNTIVGDGSGASIRYPLANDLSLGPHTIWFTKITEYCQTGVDGQVAGIATFNNFQLDANAVYLSPPPLKKINLLFIGDSCCTGYGALGAVPAGTSTNPCLFTLSTQDATQSTPQAAADQIGANLINLASSGKGIAGSMWDPDPNHLLPLFYPQMVPVNPNSIWNPKRTNIDVVVISAGGDDVRGAPGSGHIPDMNSFVTAYAKLLQQIRTDSPNALIVCGMSESATGTDKQDLTTGITQAISNRTQTGDSNIFFFVYWTDTPYQSYDQAASALKLDYGCNFHVGPQGAQYLGMLLANFIKSKM